MFLHRMKHYHFDFQKNAILPCEKRALFYAKSKLFFKTLLFFQFLIFSRDSGSSSGESHIV